MSDLFTVLTPPGKAALATVGLCGPRAWDIARTLFRPRNGKPLPEQPQPQRYWLGSVGEELADEGILAVRSVQPLAVELHVHGSREVLRYLSELLTLRGARSVGWQEWLSVQQGDAIRAAALVALAQAKTLRVANILLDQYHGALAQALAQLERADDAAALRQQLLQRSRLGLRLVEGFRVVIAGPPNAGKSSLVNALAGYQRSIVAPTPGTTRDVVTTTLAIDGWPVELADTAGLRVGGESLESLGMQQAREAAATADVCLWLVDASVEPVWPAERPDNLRVVVSKCDLPPAWDLRLAGDALRVSATTGEGLAALCQALSRWLVPEVPPAGAAVPFTSEQVAWIERAIQPDGAYPEQR